MTARSDTAPITIASTASVINSPARQDDSDPSALCLGSDQLGHPSVRFSVMARLRRPRVWRRRSADSPSSPGSRSGRTKRLGVGEPTAGIARGSNTVHGPWPLRRRRAPRAKRGRAWVPRRVADGESTPPPCGVDRPPGRAPSHPPGPRLASPWMRNSVCGRRRQRGRGPARLWSVRTFETHAHAVGVVHLDDLGFEQHLHKYFNAFEDVDGCGRRPATTHSSSRRRHPGARPHTVPNSRPI